MTQSTSFSSLESPQKQGSVFNTQSQPKRTEREKEKTKLKVVRTTITLHEGPKVTKQEKQAELQETKLQKQTKDFFARRDLEREQSPTNDDEDEESPRRQQLRSKSCPSVPQLNVFHKDLPVVNSSRSRNNSDAEEPIDGTAVSDKNSTSTRKPRSHSAVSSSSQPPPTSHLKAECQTKILKHQDLMRQREFTSEVEILSSIFKFFKTQPLESPLYNNSQVLLEQMITEIKAVNNQALKGIDSHLNKQNAYLDLLNQINLDYKLFCRHVTDFYQDMLELHKVLTSEHIQIIALDKEVPKEELCNHLATYITNDKANVNMLSKLQSPFLTTMLSENKTALKSAINRHITNCYLLAKDYLKEIGEKNIHLEKHGEKVWLEVGHKQGASQTILAQELLLKIPRCSVQEKLMFEGLCTKIASRVEQRDQVPAIAENRGIQVLTDWINLIDKGADKLYSEEKREEPVAEKKKE